MTEAIADICELDRAIFAIIGAEGATNFGIVRGQDGEALLIDADIRRIDEIEYALKETGCRRIRYLFNSHENFDHSSANIYFEKKGALVLCSEGCRQALAEDGEAKFGEMSGRVPELFKRFPDLKLGMPQVTFAQAATVHLSDLSIDLVYAARGGRSHSRGDAIAIVEGKRILFAGDLLYTEVHPVTVYGSIPNWIESIDRLTQGDFDAVVPGHGPVAIGEDAYRKSFLTFRQYLEDFYARLREIGAGRNSAADVEAYMKGGKYASLGKNRMVKRNIEIYLKEGR